MSSVASVPSKLGVKKNNLNSHEKEKCTMLHLSCAVLSSPSVQVRKTLDATMQTLQDMLTVEDFDVSDAFQHSRSTESIKSVASESYMSKLNVAKRRANQQETEMFYFSVSPY